MQMRTISSRALLIATVLVAMASVASAQNLFVNPSFEAGPTGGGASGWITFGNVFTEADNGGQFIAHSGNQLVSMFGNFTGGFNVTGMFQEFPASPGTQWQMSSFARHYSGDAMIGSQAAGGNWVVQKIVFKDAADVEIGAVESMILDGSYPTDVWHASGPILGVAPAGTVQVEAFILYLQPAFDGGAAQIDDVELLNLGPVAVESESFGAVKALFNN